jgi:hypothetical protein
MLALDAVVRVAAPWSSLFGHSRPVEMATVGTHVLSMLVAGGLAIAHDRGTLRISGSHAAAIRGHHLDELRAVHRPVVIALAVCMASGVALFASDVETYALSPTFWIKLGLIALLLVNALMMQSAERVMSVATVGVTATGAATAAWSRIRVSSIVSVALWASIVLVSIVLSLEK